MNLFLSVLMIGLATYGFLVAFAYVCADSIIFQPREASYVDGERITKIPADDGTPISAVFLNSPGARHTIFHLHGNALDLGDAIEMLEDFHRAGFSVAAFDYRGYGTTPGKPEEGNVHADAEAVYRHLVNVQGVDPSTIILYGQSVGSGPAVELAVRHPVGGLVIEGGFKSAFRVLTGVTLLPGDRFRNLEKMPRVRCPVLVIHGQRDGTVPFSHGRALFQAAPEPKSSLFVEGAGHNDLVEVAGDQYWSALREFAAGLSD